MAGVRPVNAGWFNAFRPWTLHGAVVPVALGGVYAYIHGSQEWFLFLLALIGGVLLQSACNLLNTYGDFETGLDTEENHSRSPELVSGKLRAKDVLMVGLEGNEKEILYSGCHTGGKKRKCCKVIVHLE